MNIIKNIKIWLRGILLLTLFLVFTDIACFSQVASVQTDTTKVSQNPTQTDNANQEQIKEQEQNQNQGTALESSNTKAVKQVRSAKPDMSKARGARPNIVRPSGSNIPKGAGKPGGVKRIGGR